LRFISEPKVDMEVQNVPKRLGRLWRFAKNVYGRGSLDPLHDLLKKKILVLVKVIDSSSIA
jgi:hypothetical protein